MFRKVLVPLDGSELSAQALPIVERLVRGSNAEVTLLSVAEAPQDTSRSRRQQDRPLTTTTSLPGATPQVTLPADPLRFAESRDQAVERREHELKEYLEEAGSPLREAGLQVRTEERFGDAANEIIGRVRHGEFDLIVMATHGRSGLSEALHGSVATEVIRSGVAPILLVRPTGQVDREASQPRLEAKRR